MVLHVYPSGTVKGLALYVEGGGKGIRAPRDQDLGAAVTGLQQKVEHFCSAGVKSLVPSQSH